MSRMADDHAFLSARVPAEVRNRFKALAASRGVNVQTLLREAVEAYVRAQTPPDLAGVLKTLRAHRGDLLDMGLDRLSVVGSVARGEAKPGSDIDIAFRFRDDLTVSALDYGELQARLEDWLPGARIDIAPWKSLRPDVADNMARDAVEAL
jgi:predicted nucleotidyltransferase